MNDLVSIIIPAYNAEKTINYCLESIINQTFSNLEILVINDGSKDNTLELLKSFDDSRLTIIDKKNGGVSAARNDGLKKATGKYVLFVDADDYVDLNLVHDCLEIMQNKNADIIRFNGYIVKNDFKKKIEFPFEHDYYLNNMDKKQIEEIIDNPSTGIRCYTPLLFIKNNSIIEFNTELTYLEDKIFYLENFLNDKNIYFYNKCLYYYVFNNDSKTKDVNKFDKNIYDIISVKPYIENILNKYQLYDEKKINTSLINLILYRFDYYVSCNAKKNDLASIINKYQIINIPINEEMLTSFKRKQYNAIKKNKLNYYFIITKIKNNLKR